MASSRKPGQKVDTEVTKERKRRKSDLVVMWESIWDVTRSIVVEVWSALCGVFEATRRLLLPEENQEIRMWLGKYLTRVPEDFAESWRDGVLLSTLLNGLQPGCFPDFKKLDINYALRNIYQAFHILEARFDAIPKVIPEEIVTCCEGSDAKLLELLLQLKQKSEEEQKGSAPVDESGENEEEKSAISCGTKICVAKGTGLMVGFAGRTSNFVVFCASMSELDLVIDIRGPDGSSCCERITKRSPKKKQPVKPWKPTSPHNFVRSISNQEIEAPGLNHPQMSKKEDANIRIFLEYEINKNQINFAYTPILKGDHRISILSHGQHASESPYTVEIDNPMGTNKKETATSLIESLKQTGAQHDRNGMESKPSVLKFQETAERKEKLGRIIKKRVLRYIVKINDKDVVVDTESIHNLATSLLKMDYEYQKDPLCRRNSWGFVGDSERKVSVIRQFGVNPGELEAQSAKMHRSQSLSFNSKSKRTFTKRNSYECEDIPQQVPLQTVAEGRISEFEPPIQNGEDDAEFAYVNEEFAPGEECQKLWGKDSSNLNEKYIVIPPTVHEKYPEEGSEFASKENGILDRNILNHLEILNAKELKLENFTRNRYTKWPLDHLTRASETSTKSVAEINKNLPEALTPMEVNISQVTSGYNHETSLERCDLRDTNLLSSNREVNRKIIGHDSRTADSCSPTPKETAQILTKCKNYDDVFIEETPCTKIDIRSLNSNQINKSLATSNQTWGVDALEDLRAAIGGEEFTTFKHTKHETFSTINSVKDLSNRICDKASDQQNVDMLIEKEIFLDTKCESLEQNEDFSQSRKTLVAPYLIAKKRKRKLHKVLKYPRYYSKRTPVHEKKRFIPLNFQKDFGTQQKGKMETRSFSWIYKKDVASETSAKKRPPPESKNFTSTDNNQNYSETQSSNLVFSQENVGIDSNHFHKYTVPTINTALKQISLIKDLKIENEQNHDGSKELYVYEPSKAENNFSSLSLNPKDRRESFSTKISNPNKCSSVRIINYSQENNLGNDFNETCQNSLNAVRGSAKESFALKTHTLVSLGHLNFKHFNLPLQTDKGGLVKNRIKQWDHFITRDVQNENSAHMEKLDTPDIVNVKAKLEFWENACQKQINTQPALYKDGAKEPDARSEENDMISNTSETSLPGVNFEKNEMVQRLFPIRTHDENAINKEENVSWKKHIDDKFPVSVTSSQIPKRSSSDPGVLETSNLETLRDSELFEDQQNQSKEIMSCSSGSSVEKYSTDEEFLEIDTLSTEDEYIDDEISECASMYWGNLSHMRHLKGIADVSQFEEFWELTDADFLKHQIHNRQQFPAECKVYGIASYFGHVAVKNKFRVLTKGAGRGNLTATVQGFGHHEVSFVTVEYAKKDIYEVTYQVMNPGIYLISVRWMDSPILGSPFLCKVAY